MIMTTGNFQTHPHQSAVAQPAFFSGKAVVG
jgi:hypothetical protein